MHEKVGDGDATVGGADELVCLLVAGEVFEFDQRAPIPVEEAVGQPAMVPESCSCRFCVVQRNTARGALGGQGGCHGRLPQPSPESATALCPAIIRV